MADELSAARSMLAMGDTAGANRALRRLLRENPKVGKGEGWWLLAEVLDDPAQAAECRQRAQTAGFKPPAGTPPVETNLLARLGPPPAAPPAAMSPPTLQTMPLASPPVNQASSFVPSSQPLTQNQCPRCGFLTPTTIRFCGGCGLDYAAPVFMAPQMLAYVPAPAQRRTWVPWLLGGLVVVCIVFALLNSLGTPSSRTPALGSWEAGERAYQTCALAGKNKVPNPRTAKPETYDEIQILNGKSPKDWLLTVDVAYDAGGETRSRTFACVVVQNGDTFVLEEIVGGP